VGSAQRSGYKKFFEGEKEDHKEQVTPIFLAKMSQLWGFIFFIVICKPLGDVACCFLATVITTMSRFLVNMHCNRFTNQIDECRKSRADMKAHYR
jgi:hypothetical protein